MDSAGLAQPGGSIRIRAGRAFLWSAFAAGVLVNLVELYWLVEAIRQMSSGSDTAALIGMWFGVPIVPLGPVLFGVGWGLARRSDPRAFRAGLAGALISVLAVPLWFAVALSITLALGLG